MKDIEGQSCDVVDGVIVLFEVFAGLPLTEFVIPLVEVVLLTAELV